MHDELSQVPELGDSWSGAPCQDGAATGIQQAHNTWTSGVQQGRIYIYMGGRVQSVMPSQHRPRLDGERVGGLMDSRSR